MYHGPGAEAGEEEFTVWINQKEVIFFLRTEGILRHKEQQCLAHFHGYTQKNDQELQ